MAPLGVWQNWWLNKEHDIYMCLVLCSVVWLKMWHPQSWEGVSAHSDISPHVYMFTVCTCVHCRGGTLPGPLRPGSVHLETEAQRGPQPRGGNWELRHMRHAGCWAVGGGGGYSMSWQVWRNWWCDQTRHSLTWYHHHRGGAACSLVLSKGLKF